MDASTKKCSSCGQTKPLEEFNRRAASRDGRQPCCRACSKMWYQRNVETVVARTAARNRSRRDAARDVVDAYLLTHPCVDCDEPEPRLLEFDHRDRLTKSAAVSVLVTRGASRSTLLSEIAKCDVRCANCHRRKTVMELGWWLSALPGVDWELWRDA